MKKWFFIRAITIIILILFIIYIVIDLINCLSMTYPHPMLGVDANTWVDQFIVDLVFILISMGIPMIIDIVLLIVSIKKIRSKK